MGDLSPAPPVRVEAATGNEKQSARERQTAVLARVPKPVIKAAEPPPVPDLDLEKDEKHQLDERA